MKKKKEFFENLARNWDKEHNTVEENERTLQFACKHFRLYDGETVLDIGCGTGRLIPHLETSIGSTGKLVELDFSIEMLRIGKNRYDYQNLFFIQGDGHVLPLKDESIDTVICFAFFPHLSDKQKAMETFARVLKTHGRIFIAHQMNREELNRFHGNVNGPVTKDLLPDEASMKKLFESTGFDEVYIREEPGLYIAYAEKNF